jgi:hypothetical protein
MDRIELKKAIIFVVVVAVLSGLALGADEAAVRRGGPGPRFGRGMAADPNNIMPGGPMNHRRLGRNRSFEQPAVPQTTDETVVPGRGHGFGRGRALRQDGTGQGQGHHRQSRGGIGTERPGYGRARRQKSEQWQNQCPCEDRRGFGPRSSGRRQRLNAEQGSEPGQYRDESGEKPGWHRGRGPGRNRDESAATAEQGARGRRLGRSRNSQGPDEFRDSTPRERLQRRIRGLRRFGERMRQRMRDWQ